MFSTEIFMTNSLRSFLSEIGGQKYSNKDAKISKRQLAFSDLNFIQSTLTKKSLHDCEKSEFFSGEIV